MSVNYLGIRYLPLGIIKSKNFLYYIIISRYEFFLIPTDDINIKNRTPREDFSDLFLSLLNKEEIIRE